MKKSCIKASIIVLITVFISLSVMPISVFAEESDTSEALSEVQTNSEGNERYYLGETIKAGDDDGYDKDKTIKKKDPHYDCSRCKGYPALCIYAKKSCPSFDVHEYDYIFNNQAK